MLIRLVRAKDVAKVEQCLVLFIAITMRDPQASLLKIDGLFIELVDLLKIDGDLTDTAVNVKANVLTLLRTFSSSAKAYFFSDGIAFTGVFILLYSSWFLYGYIHPLCYDCFHPLCYDCFNPGYYDVFIRGYHGYIHPGSYDMLWLHLSCLL